jgi:uncharacterized protein YndB with AHSA1/START domain
MSSEPNVIVTVTRHFDAPAERVFDAWLDPEQVREWMAVSGSMKNLRRVHIDARLGGAFAFVDVREGEKVEHVGNYLEIERPLSARLYLAGEAGGGEQHCFDRYRRRMSPGAKRRSSTR